MSLDRPRLERKAFGVGKRIGKDLSVGMVLAQAIHVVLKRVERAGGDDSDLPHRSPEELAQPPGLANGVGLSEELWWGRFAQKRKIKVFKTRIGSIWKKLKNGWSRSDRSSVNCCEVARVAATGCSWRNARHRF